MAIQVGEVVHAMVSAIAAAFFVTWVVLIGYRRAVARTMRTASTRPEQQAAAGPAPASFPSSIRSTATLLPSVVARRRLLLVYAVAFAISSMPQALPMAQKFFSGGDAVSWPGLLIHYMSLFAPAVVLLAALVAATRGATIGVLLAAAVTAMAIAVVVPALVRLSTGNWSIDGLVMNAFWAGALFVLTALPPLALVYVSGRRRVRNVMPVMLSAVVLLSVLLMLFNHWQMGEVQDLSRANPALMWLVTRIGPFWGPSLVFLLLSVPVGLAAWGFLLRMQRRYEARRFSNVQLMIHAWWGIVIAFESLSVASDLGVPMGIVVGLVCFALFVVTVRIGLRISGLAGRSGGRTMLLLRVFGFQERTEALFDRLAERWRFEGPVAMIAGVDLALRSVDIDEAMAYLQGNIESRYVAGPTDLGERLRRMDGQADPDGRFRVEEFFCFDDTWKSTLQALVSRADIVLMDLRGFTQANAGCVYELQQLAALGALSRCVFVADATTDRALAEKSLGFIPGSKNAPAWISMPRESAGVPQLWRELTLRSMPAPATGILAAA